MRKSIGLPALLTVLLLLCSCSAQPISDGKQISFTDSMNNAISLENTPETVAVLFSSYPEIWNLAGGTVSVTVGESVERGFVPAETPLVDSGAGKTINVERLLAAQPDFVIGSADIDAQVEACGLLQQAAGLYLRINICRTDDEIGLGCQQPFHIDGFSCAAIHQRRFGRHKTAFYALPHRHRNRAAGKIPDLSVGREQHRHRFWCIFQ